jgi:hypothetical protein
MGTSADLVRQVLFLTVLDTASTILLMHQAWFYFIHGWGNFEVLDILPR